MKTILENYEVIITSDWEPKDYTKDLKEGDVIDYRNTVKDCYLYYQIDGNIVKVILDKKMILELANNIKSLESEIEKFKYTNTLF